MTGFGVLADVLVCVELVDGGTADEDAVVECVLLVVECVAIETVFPLRSM